MSGAGTRPGDFALRAREVLEERPTVRAAVTEGTLRAQEKRRKAFVGLDEEAWKEWARATKTHLLGRLDHYLLEAEASLVANDVRVHWAEDAPQARRILGGIVEEAGLSSAVKAKSMLSEELEVNAFLEKRGLSVRETDLGEYILQMLGEAPSHIVGPAMHKTLEDCQELFADELGTPPDASAEVIAAAARRRLRRDFLEADLGISGANFLVAETGTVALMENEGNIRLSTSLPRVHVAFVGIEKLLPRLADLAGFLQILPRSATGQVIGNYVSLLQGPRRPGEPDGPEEMHVVLVDNGRTRLLADDQGHEALRCIRCGACLNVCPVYRQSGGHPYGWVYSGPIGAILAPGLLGLEEAMPLPYASSLCGACGDVCPVKIPIPELLVYWRERAVEEGLVPRSEAWGMAGYTAAALHPRLFHAAEALAGVLTGPAGEVLARRLPMVGHWAEGRSLPSAQGPTFRELWTAGLDDRRDDG